MNYETPRNFTLMSKIERQLPDYFPSATKDQLELLTDELTDKCEERKIQDPVIELGQNKAGYFLWVNERWALELARNEGEHYHVNNFHFPLNNPTHPTADPSKAEKTKDLRDLES